MRETLFDWLGPGIVDAQCLDLFAGSGALGLEAASRGAGAVVLNDRDAGTCQRLRALLARLAAANDESTRQAARRVSVWQRSAESALAQCDVQGMRIDLVFLDPPFGEPGRAAELLRRLAPRLHAQSRVYFEAEQPIDPQIIAACRFELLRHGRAGRVHYHLLAMADMPADNEETT